MRTDVVAARGDLVGVLVVGVLHLHLALRVGMMLILHYVVVAVVVAVAVHVVGHVAVVVHVAVVHVVHAVVVELQKPFVPEGVTRRYREVMLGALLGWIRIFPTCGTSSRVIRRMIRSGPIGRTRTVASLVAEVVVVREVVFVTMTMRTLAHPIGCLRCCCYHCYCCCCD